jgi:hypothetical protein
MVMIKKQIFVTACLFLFFLSADVFGACDKVAITFTTDKSTYQNGETAKIMMAIVNSSKKTVKFPRYYYSIGLTIDKQFPENTGEADENIKADQGVLGEAKDQTKKFFVIKPGATFEIQIYEFEVKIPGKEVGTCRLSGFLIPFVLKTGKVRRRECILKNKMTWEDITFAVNP